MNLLSVLLLTFFAVDTLGGLKNQGQCPQIKLRFGRVRYRQRGKIARFVCNVGYMLAGDRYSVCVQGHWDNSSPRCVRATCMDAKPPINGLIYPSHGGAVLNFYCKSNYQLRGPNTTYCDGKHWDNPLPTCLPTNSTPPLSCTFETPDICGWNHDLNHDFEWKRLNYATPSGSIGTGPSYDHTKGPGKDGYYMYIESSARNINDTARLISPVYDKTQDDVCVEFYYHMYGVTTGDLRVYLKKVNQTWNFDPSNAIFAKNGNQGDRWYRAFLELGVMEDDYQIVIEGIRGPGYVSDIAIDDVRIIKNCDPDEEILTTTEAWASSEAPISVESCEDRCSTNDTQSSDLLITCDCDELCFDRNRCCPDYFDFCVLGTSPDDVEESTSETSSTVETSTDTTPTNPTTKATSTTVLEEITRKEESKIVYVKPDDEDDDEVPLTNSDELDKESDPINDYETEKTVNQKIVVPHKTSENNTKTTVFVVGVVFGVLFGVVGMAFVARRYRLLNFNCDGLRGLKQSSHGDSQSDVRFLTSDEALDFTLPRDYDAL